MRVIKPLLIVVFLLFECNFVYSKINKKKVEKLAKTINIEIREYVESCKPNSIKNGKYDVYVVNMYYVDLNKRKICLTIGSISNTYEFEDVYSDYVYYFNGEIVLLRLNTELDSSILNIFKYKKFDQYDKIKVMSKLIPINEGQITSDEGCMTLSLNKNKIKRKIKQDSELLPFETIFKRPIIFQMELQ